MKAVVINKIGGTDVMECVDRPEPIVTPGHVVVEVAAAGVNFLDIGVRQGMAWTETPNPKVLGVETPMFCSASKWFGCTARICR